jgi:hypothetical protein
VINAVFHPSVSVTDEISKNFGLSEPRPLSQRIGASVTVISKIGSGAVDSSDSIGRRSGLGAVGTRGQDSHAGVAHIDFLPAPPELDSAVSILKLTVGAVAKNPPVFARELLKRSAD